MHNMEKEAGRRCSQCGHNGHNSRTCSEKGCVKLFGVNILEKRDEPLKKSVSLDNLKTLLAQNKNNTCVEGGYMSDGFIGFSREISARKKGKPWTEDEHRTFLAGLKRLGKGKWKGISRNFVPTKTPTQVASHAQKYFLRRRASSDKKIKLRSSVFGMPYKDSASASQDSSNLPPIIKTPISSSHASTPAALPLKKNVEVPSQDTTTSQIKNQLPHSCLANPVVNPTIAAGGLPNYTRIPYMLGVPGNGRRYVAAKAVALEPYPWMMNYVRPGYPYTMPHNSTGSIATCSPLAVHPSGIPWPRPYPHNHTQQDASTSSSKREDPLELGLKIGPTPQSPQPGLSSQPSGLISVT